MENKTFTHIPLQLKITDIQHFLTHDLMLKFYKNLSIKRSYAKLVLPTWHMISKSLHRVPCGKKQKVMKSLYKTLDRELKEGKKARINVFLTQEEYKKLNDIKNKYHISLSTIVSIIVQQYSVLRAVTDKASEGRILKQEKSNKKTSIKPFIYYEKQPAVFYENLIHMFCNDSVKDYVPLKIHEKVKNMIYNRFEITQDPMYDYNEFIRKAWIYDKYRRKAEL